MPIAEIIHQIDAYLFSLRQARELLSAPIQVPRERTSPQKRKIKTQETASGASAKPRIQKQTSRAGVSAPEQRVRKNRVAPRVDASLQESGSQTKTAAEPERQPQVDEPKPAANVQPELVISTERLPAAKQVNRVRAVRHSAPRQPARPKVELPKPAIALAGSMNSRIVVVSAEQARQERNRTTPVPEVRRPRLPSTGLNGKLAFEALFKDPSDPSRSSE